MTRLSALLVLALMVYAAMPPKAVEAAPLCSSLHGTSCPTRWASTSCVTDWGTKAECHCMRELDGSLHWECPI
jgi:hypothetical protein